MSKYLEYFEGAFDSTVVDKRKLENKPYVAYSIKESKVVYTEVPKPTTGLANNEIWFKANQPVTESDIISAFTNANIIGLKYEDDWYKIVYDDEVSEIDWCNSENVQLPGSRMTEIYLPNSVTGIWPKAFGRCTSLTSITFNGTMEEWNSVNKGSKWNANVPATYVQCTDGQVAL